MAKKLKLHKGTVADARKALAKTAGADDDTFVWGTSLEDGDTFVWGTRKEFEAALASMADGDSLVWGT